METTPKKIILISILIVILGAFAAWTYYSFFIEKSLAVASPNGKEVWEANKTYQIRWKGKKIGKVGIMLMKEGTRETEWIAKEVPGLDGKYDWNIFVWQEPRQDYKIAIFEYPWKEGNKIDYSDENFTILGPAFASCDAYSVEKEWPFVPSDYPDLRKVFITENSWNGNLEGLEGADKKCQAEADSGGLTGTWKALLGNDQTVAVSRLNLEGIFVNARTATTLPEGKTCHELWGRNFDEFFKKFSNTLTVNKEKFSSEFLQKELPNVWLGRINDDSKRECVLVAAKFAYIDPNRQYSFTTTCQNWTIGDESIEGYPPSVGSTLQFPICYNTQGQKLSAVSLSGLGIGLVGLEVQSQYYSPALGLPCNQTHKLMCVQQ